MNSRWWQDLRAAEREVWLARVRLGEVVFAWAAGDGFEAPAAVNRAVSRLRVAIMACTPEPMGEPAAMEPDATPEPPWGDL